MGKHNKDFRRSQERRDERKVLDSDVKGTEEFLQQEEEMVSLFEEPIVENPSDNTSLENEEEGKALIEEKETEEKETEEKETIVYEEPNVEETEELETFSTRLDKSRGLVAIEKFRVTGMTDDGFDVTGIVYYEPKKNLILLIDGRDKDAVPDILDYHVDKELVLDPSVRFNIFCYMPRFLPDPYKIEIKQESNITTFLNYFHNCDYSYESSAKKLLEFLFRDIVY